VLTTAGGGLLLDSVGMARQITPQPSSRSGSASMASRQQ
jgi:hypothetical protein